MNVSGRIWPKRSKTNAIMDEISRLKDIAAELRKKIFRMALRAGGGHIAPAFSTVEVLTALYFKILKIDAKKPLDDSRDRFILSKGHGCAALYAVLAQAGFIEEKLLDSFCREGGLLGGHPDIQMVPGIEATTGALGHGIVFAAGIALAGKIDEKNYRVFTLVGDGECQEGSVWETAMFASHHRLDNLIAIVDYNKLQALGPISDIMGLEPLKEKWEAFGWAVREVDGHDLKEIVNVLSAVPFEKDKPNLLIAHTVKGKGISFMENVPIWHYRLPEEEQLAAAFKELGMNPDEELPG